MQPIKPCHYCGNSKIKHGAIRATLKLCSGCGVVRFDLK